MIFFNKLGDVLFFFILSFISLSVFAYSISPFTIGEGYDSCVFKQMGLIILQGKIPYIDLFDHKGPILYYINALGLWIGDRWGLFMLNVLNLTFVFYLWILTIRHYVRGFRSYIILFIILPLFVLVLDEGNMTEHWSLLPLSYAIYLSSRMLVYGTGMSSVESFLMGVSGGFIAFIRPNNAALLICVFILITYLTRNQYRLLLKYYLYATIGFLLIVLAVFVLFYINYGKNGVEEMLYGSLFFNFEYINNEPRNYSTFSFFFQNTLIYRFFFTFSVFLCFCTYFTKSKKKNIIAVFYILSFFFCYYTMGRKAYPHYLITIIPLFVLAVSYVFKGYMKGAILCCIIISYLFFPYYFSLTLNEYGSPRNENYTYYCKADSIINSIEDKWKGQIWNYNTGFGGIQILQRNGLVQCNRVVHNFQYEISESLRKIEENKLQSIQPKFILFNTTKPYVFKNDSLFINSNYILKERFDSELLFYERADIEIEF